MHILFSPPFPFFKHFYALFVHCASHIFLNLHFLFLSNAIHKAYRLLPHLGVRNDGLNLPRNRGMEGSVERNALDTVEAVKVLVACNLEDGCRSLPSQIFFQLLPTHAPTTGIRKGILILPRRDDGISQEEGPDPVPPLAILGNTFVLVAQPVLVPSVKSSRIVYSKDVDGFDLKVGVLELGDDPVESARSVGAGEDVLVHATE